MVGSGVVEGHGGRGVVGGSNSLAVLTLDEGGLCVCVLLEKMNFRWMQVSPKNSYCDH